MLEPAKIFHVDIRLYYPLSPLYLFSSSDLGGLGCKTNVLCNIRGQRMQRMLKNTLELSFVGQTYAASQSNNK